MAVIVSGKTIYAVDIQSESPRILSSAEAPSKIVSFEIGKVSRVVQTQFGIGIEVESIKADLELEGEAGKFTLLLDGGKIVPFETPSELSSRKTPALDSTKVTVLSDAGNGTEVIATGSEAYIRNMKTGGLIAIGEIGSDALIVSSGVHFDASDITTVAMGKRFVVVDNKKGSIWAEHEVEGDISGIQLVEIPTSDGLFQSSSTMSMVTFGKVIKIINIQTGCEPQEISSHEFSSTIESVIVSKQTGLVQLSPGIQAEADGIIVRVKLTGEEIETLFLIERGDLRLLEEKNR